MLESLQTSPPICDLCGGDCIALPSPGIAMLSDGRPVDAPLAKLSCLHCGATSHVRTRSIGQVRAAFDEDYSLGATKAGADLRRGTVYANAILDAVKIRDITRVLDIGCGGGDMLQAMHLLLPGAQLVGIEAAGQAASAAAAIGITIHQGFAEDLEAPSQPFDLVCSVNVIEHSGDPLAFLRALAGQVREDGRIAVVCPRADVPNLELLFFDHTHSLTGAAFAELALQAQLDVIAHVALLPDAGDFQLFVLARSKTARSNEPNGRARGRDAQQLATKRTDYLEAWLRLDECLGDAVPEGQPLVCFGATEAAALLRTYAPQTWARIRELTVDDPASAWRLDKPVVAYKPDRWPKAQPVILAVHPARQEMVAARLAGDGFAPILWPGAIRR